jgi:hypothetical protein
MEDKITAAIRRYGNGDIDKTGQTILLFSVIGIFSHLAEPRIKNTEKPYFL